MRMKREFHITGKILSIVDDRLPVRCLNDRSFKTLHLCNRDAIGTGKIVCPKILYFYFMIISNLLNPGIKDFPLPYSATAAEIKAFHRKCADHGVTGYGVGPIYMKKGEARKYFDYAKAVGVKVLVAVPFEDGEVNGKKTRVGSRACCETLSELCREYGDIKIAIHNHGPDIPYCFPTGDSAFEMVKDLDPRVGLCLDIGHNFRAGLDPAASIRKLHTRIFDMHVKNVKFDAKKNLATPMPRGDMKLPEVVKALCEVGYTGCCSLEYESFPAKGVRPGIKYDDIAESVGYFQGLMKAAENV